LSSYFRGKWWESENLCQIIKDSRYFKAFWWDFSGGKIKPTLLTVAGATLENRLYGKESY
jgi:hypothetical protein